MHWFMRHSYLTVTAVTHNIHGLHTSTSLPRFTEAGLAPDTARELVIAMICALEGAFVLARAARSTEPLRVAGELTAQAVERALA